MFTPDQAKVFILDQLSKPYSWWIGVGLAAIGGVFWGKMKAPLSNYVLAAGIIAIGLAVWIHPSVRTQPAFVRVLCTIAALSTLGSLSYFTLWVPKRVMTFTAFCNSSEKRSDAEIAGIKWSDRYTELQVTIVNRSDSDFSDVDLVIMVDQPLAKAAVLNDAQAVIAWHESPQVAMQVLKRDTGRMYSLPTVMVASLRGCRLRADVMPRKSSIILVFAVVAVNEKHSDTSPNFSVKFPHDDGKAVWIGRDMHTDDIYEKLRPTPKTVSISGRFQALERENEVDRLIQVEQPFEKAVDELRKLGELGASTNPPAR